MGIRQQRKHTRTSYCHDNPASPVKTPGPAYGALVPQPTQQIPSNQKLYFQVQKNPGYFKDIGHFHGSAGAGSIKSAEIKVTHPDGSVATGIILPLKGVTEITLDEYERG